MKVKQGFKLVHTEHDSYGNAILVYQEPISQNFLLYLRLKSESPKIRFIGEVDTENQTLFVTRNRQRHFHRISGSYGFNWLIIQRFQYCKRIMLCEIIERDTGNEVHYYIFTPKQLKDIGFNLFFEQVGFELQRFMKKEHLQMFLTHNTWKEGKLIQKHPVVIPAHQNQPTHVSEDI